MPSVEYGVITAGTHPWRLLQAWYRLPLALVTLIVAPLHSRVVGHSVLGLSRQKPVKNAALAMHR